MLHSRSIPQQKIRVIGNGIQLDKYKRLDNSLRQRKCNELGIDADVKIVGTVTRLREEKGNEYLIRAVPVIMKQGVDFVLVIAGDGPLRANLERLVMDLGIENLVKFLGYRSDVSELLSLFDVQVIPSLTEGFPLSLAEAMAAGNAIVATEVGGMKEIGKDGETLLFVPPKDPKSMGEIVAYLLNNTDIAAKLSGNAVEYSKIFGIENSVVHLQQAYEDLAVSPQ
jgi:glycosyltransferase involved in cell wall biosynthesis